MNTKSILTAQQIVDGLPIGELVNTDKSPFWYFRRFEGPANPAHRYKHEEGKAGDTFYDGNNGDRWRVVAINRQYKRILVENLTQHGTHFCYWE